MTKSCKFFAVLALLPALLTFSSCNDKDLPKTLDEFITAANKMRDDALKELRTIEKDEDKMKFVDEYNVKVKDFFTKVIKANKGNEIAYKILTDYAAFFTEEEFEKLASKLNEEFRDTDKINAIRAGYAKISATREGKMFTDFEVDGVKFSDFIGKGKYVLVDFWASWCGPCRAEIPNIKAVYEKYAGEKFDVLSVAVWDKVEDTRIAADQEGIVWSQIINAQNIPTDIYGIESIPQIILFGPDGTILKRDLRGADIEKAVALSLSK